MKKITITLIVLMVISVGFLSGCEEQSSNSDNIQILSHNIKDIYGSKNVYGTVKNVADKNVDYAEVTVKYYDKENELLITKKQQISYIANGETADFSVYYYNYEKYFDQYDHYTVSIWS